MSAEPRFYRLLGHWLPRCGGDAPRIGDLLVKVMPGGALLDAGGSFHNDDLRLERRAAGVIVTNGQWRFLPCAGELARCGIIPSEILT